MSSEGLSAAVFAHVAADAGVQVRQAMQVARLFAEGNTVPFIARYRKEAHGNLDEVAILKIQERLAYYGELEARRATILESIDAQGKLTDDLREKIEACWVKSTLEDLYQPFKPKRRTRAQIAKEKGLEPLADKIWNGEPFEGTDEELSGARDILAERIADMADVRGLVREAFLKKSVVKSEVASPKPTEPTKFEQYYDFEEPIATIPSHRYLAIRRGQNEGVLWVRLVTDRAPLLARIREIIGREGPQIDLAIEDAYKRLLAPSCEIDATVEKKLEADRAAVEVFAENLRNLLLAAPLGEKVVLALDPGIRTGCKTVVIDATGKFLVNTVIFPQQRPDEARAVLGKLLATFHPEAVAVGNGTAGRETEQFVRETLKFFGVKDVIVVSVSEAGASVYSAGDVARREFPDLDLTVRGAISIGRRLQDPLAELVKIDPKAIGVGQYQHDVHQPLLSAKLDEVVVSCVNRVGVELNTASAPLLERVAGIGPSLARSIVTWRNENGAFKSRNDLKKVPGLGPRAFEQSAGFLRIRGAANPLDASGVHPERYVLVQQMASDLGVDVGLLTGNGTLAGKIDIRRYVSEEVGEPTLRDIVEELKKPGRDPRAQFERPAFRDDVMTIKDVKEGMVLEGVVTNVTAFGAFVDIGVHQDGLVHVSEIADHFVRDPAEVVKTGDRLKVRVIGVDLARQRISLSAKKNPTVGVVSGSVARGAPSGARGPRDRRGGPSQGGGFSGGFVCNPFANL